MLLFDTLVQAEQVINEAMDCTSLQNRQTKITKLYNGLLQVYKLEKELLEKKEALRNHDVKTDLMINTKRYEQVFKDMDKQLQNQEVTIPDATLLENITAELKEQIRSINQYWKGYSQQHCSNLIASLQLIKKITTGNEKTTRVIMQLNALKDKQFEGNASFQELNHLVNEGQEIINSIGLIPEVEMFLRKVATSRATMGDLSEEVFEWMKKNNVAGSIKLNF